MKRLGNQGMIWVASMAAVLGVPSAVRSNTVSPTSNYNIIGNIAGLRGKVYLTVDNVYTFKVIDSTTVYNGKFEFSGRMDVPVLAKIVSANMRGVHLPAFFLENNKILIYGSVANNNNVSVYGSVTDNKYREYLRDVEHKVQSARSDFNTMPEIAAEVNRMMMKFVDSNQDCVAAAYVLMREVCMNIEIPTKIIQYKIGSFSDEVKQSVYVKEMESYLKNMAETSVGRRFTNIIMPNIDGRQVSLSSLLHRGKYILVHFWGSWCEPCRYDNQELRALYERFATRGLEIYAVSLDQKREDWLRGIRESGSQNWINVSNLNFWDCDAARDYGIRTIPYNILVAPDGSIVARGLRGAALESKVSQLLSRPN